MVQRMQPNTHPDINGYHDVEHDYRTACDDHPVCKPVHLQLRPTRPRIDDDPVAGVGYDPPPSHYATDRGIDPWAVWDAYDLDRYTANAVKYLLRAGKKDIAPRLDDLKKARNYINKAIEMEEKK